MWLLRYIFAGIGTVMSRYDNYRQMIRFQVKCINKIEATNRQLLVPIQFLIDSLIFFFLRNEVQEFYVVPTNDITVIHNIFYVTHKQVK